MSQLFGCCWLVISNTTNITTRLPKHLLKFRCHGNKGRPHNILFGFIQSAIPENPLLGANIEGALQTNIQAGRRLDSAPVSDVVTLATKVGPAGRLRW